MISVVDCNNFWSPSGGGVRRYHLEKMEFYKQQPEVAYTFVMHDASTYSEQIGENAFIQHLKVPKVMGNWEYRYLIKSAPLTPILCRLNPDIIEVGSPYFMPGIVQRIVRKNNLKARVFGFWHADFPVTYVRRFLQNAPFGLANAGEGLAWRHARKYYNKMAGTFVSSEVVKTRMEKNGLKNIHFLPLGVDAALFHPSNFDQSLVDRFKMGDNDRLLLFFPHRFSREKGLDLLLEAYPLMEKLLGKAPVLVIAGMGPLQQEVEKAASQYEHIHFHGFIRDKQEMARFYASADLGFALSKWETFGLSLLESLSSGLPLIAADDGAAMEHINRSGAGMILNQRTPQGLAEAVAQFVRLKASGNFSEKARQYAETLTWETCFSNQLKVYQGSPI